MNRKIITIIKKCEKCDNEIKDEREKCPYCENNLQHSKSNLKLLVYVIVYFTNFLASLLVDYLSLPTLIIALLSLIIARREYPKNHLVKKLIWFTIIIYIIDFILKL